jgi:hypothetical protein
MKNGDEGNQITFDDQVGLVLFTKAVDKSLVTRAVHVSSCAWVEWERTDPRDLPEAPKK